MPNTATVPVTRRAIEARLGRKLRHEAEHLHRSRGWEDRGVYYAIDSRNNVQAGGDLEELARHYGVIAPGEYLEAE